MWRRSLPAFNNSRLRAGRRRRVGVRAVAVPAGQADPADLEEAVVDLGAVARPPHRSNSRSWPWTASRERRPGRRFFAKKSRTRDITRATARLRRHRPFAMAKACLLI